jgi:hypothetical protein
VNAYERAKLLETISEVCEEVVTGFVLVVELAGTGGARTLWTISSDALGEAELPTWTAEGLLNYAIRESMFDPLFAEEDDDGDDD